MGTYMKALMGRVKPRSGEQTVSSTALVMTGVNDEQPTDFDQFEFGDCDVEIGQSYILFGWLAGVRGNCEPAVDTSALCEATYEFVRWLDNEQRRKEDEAFQALPKDQRIYGFGHVNPSWSDDYLPYQSGSWVLYPIEMLANFDYDQPIRLQRNPHYDGSKWDDQRWEQDQKDYANDTYRGVFGEWWFNFLKWAQDNNWQFAIFSFD